MTQQSHLVWGMSASGDPFGPLDPPYVGQQKVRCQPIGLTAAFLLGTRRLKLSIQRRGGWMACSKRRRQGVKKSFR